LRLVSLNVLEQLLDLTGYLQTSIFSGVVSTRYLLSTIFILLIFVFLLFLRLHGMRLGTPTRCPTLLQLLLLALLLRLSGAHVHLVLLLIRVDLLAVIHLHGEIERLVLHLLSLHVALPSG
jgi:hypothetical protein